MKASDFFKFPASLEAFAGHFPADLPPWEWLKRIAPALAAWRFEAARPVPPGVHLTGPVYLHPSVKLPPYAIITGPAWIGPETDIRPGAQIRGNVIAGARCVLGNASEYKNCLLLDGVETAHYNYVGDSILGNRAHLGAGGHLLQPAARPGKRGGAGSGRELRDRPAQVRGHRRRRGGGRVQRRAQPGRDPGDALPRDAHPGLRRLPAGRHDRQGAADHLADQAPPMSIRTLTGIQPTGTLHLGNYFGAMRPAIDAQARGDCFYFIADYHSMTSLFDAAERRGNTLGVALDWLACGLDPAKSVFWRQSDVPEVTELAWILGTLTPKGMLERATSYKDKVAKGIAPNFGLFAYPVLMAADILLYDVNVVPVGKDQKQHLEMARDIAIKFNQTYGETLIVPEPMIREETAAVPGLDGLKMSKSYGNTIEIFGDEKALRKRKNHGDRDGQPHAAGTEARRGEEPRLAAPQALCGPGRRGRHGGPPAGGRVGLRRPEKGPLSALLGLFCTGPDPARRAGRGSGAAGADPPGGRGSRPGGGWAGPPAGPAGLRAVTGAEAP